MHALAALLLLQLLKLLSAQSLHCALLLQHLLVLLGLLHAHHHLPLSQRLRVVLS